MQDVLTKYCYHCAGFQKHVLHSTCIGNVVIAKHPLLSGEFDFSKLLKNMLIEKIALFLLFFRSLPFYLISRRTRMCKYEKGETMGYFKAIEILSGIFPGRVLSSISPQILFV